MSTAFKPPRAPTFWEVRDSYPAIDLLPSLGQVLSALTSFVHVKNGNRSR